MGGDLDDLTEKQESIVTEARKNPDKSHEEIAIKADSSASYVSQVRNEHSDLIENNNSGSSLFMLLIVLVLGLVYAAENGLL